MGEKETIQHISLRIEEFYVFGKLDPWLSYGDEKIPAEMYFGEGKKDEVKWKLLPSTVRDEDIDNLEERLNYSLPKFYRAYLKSYFHLFYNTIELSNPLAFAKGLHGRAGFTPIPSNNPFGYFEDVYFDSWDDEGKQVELRLLELGFIRFASQYEYSYYFDTVSPAPINDYSIVSIPWDFGFKDNGWILDFDLYDVGEELEPISDSFECYFNDYFKPPPKYRDRLAESIQFLTDNIGCTQSKLQEHLEANGFDADDGFVETVFYAYRRNST